MTLEFRILGPIEVVGASGALRLAGPKQRAVLAILLLRANEVVPVEQIANDLYDDEVPATGLAQVRDHVSQIRKLFAGGAADVNGSLLETRAPGYLLKLEPDQLDAARFERLVGRAAGSVAPGEAELRAEWLREALSLWRGPPLAEFAAEAFARGAIARLEELRLTALEQRIEADLALGVDGTVVGELEALVHANPLREQFRLQLMLALYRSGRQAEALDVYHETRRAFVDELGIEPSEALRELEGRILRHDPSLESPRRVARAAEPSGPPLSDRNPYKGLRAFGEDDARDFFGREALTDQLAERLGRSRFLAVVGPSGSGKSSVVRAGLVPALRVGALHGSEAWRVASSTPGTHPLEELEASLLRVAVNPPASLIEQLAAPDGRGLARAVKRVLPADDSELVLVYDQLEELFTLVEDDALRVHVLTMIESAARDPMSRLRVIVTLRADFYDRPLVYRGFAELLRDGAVTVAPLSPEEIERAIAAPAEAAGLRLEQGLIAEIVADVLDEPGALPLLQYALTELFERRAEGTLTRSAYAEIGGVSGALAQRAEELYTDLDPEGREAARQLFLQLVALGQGADTSRRVEQAQLESLDVDGKALANCIASFGAARLLSFDRDPRTRGPTVEIAHEALLGEWRRLREWIDLAREDVRTHRRLAAAAAEWEEAQRDPSMLARGSRLARFEAWAEASGLAQTGNERAYLEAGRDERDRERAAEESRRARELALERRSLNRLRTLVAVLALAVLGAAALTAFAFDQSSRSNREARIATARRLAAASVANLDVDPELSILLARQAVERATVNGAPLPDAVDALHQALASSREVLTIRNPATTAVAFSPDGSLVVTAATDGTGAIRDAKTGRALESLQPARTPIHDIAFSPDGSRLVGGADGGEVIVWNARTGKRLFALPGTGGVGFTAVAFAPDGARLATTDQTGTLSIWDLRTRRLARTIRTPFVLCGVSWSPDGGRVGAGQCGGTFRASGRVWDVRSGRLRLATAPRRRLDAAVFGLAFSPDGRSIATANIDGTADIWNERSGTRVATLSGHTGAVVALSYSPDGRLLATGSTDGTARVWDAVSHRLLFVLYGHTAEVDDLAFAPDSRRLATASEDGTVRVWDVTPQGSRDWLTLTADASGVASVAYPDATHLLTAGYEDRRSKLWDARTGALLHSSVLPPYAPYTSRFDPDGRSHTFTATAVSPDGTLSADATTGPTDATNGLVDVYRNRPDGTSQLLTTLRGHHQGVQYIEFSPDGRRIATGNWDGTAVVWDVASGRPLETLPAHNGIVERVAFSPDGGRLATAGDDTTVKLWDLKTGTRLLTLYGHTLAVTDLAFSPDGTRLATAGLDGTVRVYVLPIGELMAISRSRLTRGWTKAECEEYLPGGRCPRSP